MTEPIFDHEKLDVYRLSIVYVAASYGIAKVLGGANRHIRDQWLRAAQSIPLNIAEGNGKQNLKDKNRSFQIAGGSALECAAVHDITPARKNRTTRTTDYTDHTDSRRGIASALPVAPLSSSPSIRDIRVIRGRCSLLPE